MSQQERNLAAVRAHTDAFNRHDLDAAVACFAEDAVNHGRRVGRAGLALVLEDIHTRFPDVRLDTQEIVAVDDHVVVRSIYAGTHRGMGRLPVDGGQMVGVQPTGKRFAVQHIHWYTFRDGLIAEHRANRDDVGMLMQLGLLPAIPSVSSPALPDPVAHRNVAGTAEQTDNLAAIADYNDALTRRDLERAIAHFSEDARNHGRPVGRQGLRMVLADIMQTYTSPTDDTGVREAVAVDDCVIVRYERTLEHTGTSRLAIDGGLLMGRPPTGRSFTQRHIRWFTLKGGLIAAHRACRDDVGMLVELGVLPAPPPFPAPTGKRP